MRIAFADLVRIHVLKTNPVDELVIPSVSQAETNIDAFTRDEVETLLNHILDDNSSRGEAWKHLLSIAFACATGARQGEIMALRPSKFKIIEGKSYHAILIDESFSEKDGFKTTKTRKSRLVYCDNRLAKAMLDLQRDPNGLIFESKKDPSKPISPKCIGERLKKYIDELGFKENLPDMKVVFHSFRHYANTEFNRLGGADIANYIIGHSSKNGIMNARYNHQGLDGIITYADKCGSLISENILNRISFFNESL